MGTDKSLCSSSAAYWRLRLRVWRPTGVRGSLLQAGSVDDDDGDDDADHADDDARGGDDDVHDDGGQGSPFLYIQTPDRPPQRLLLVRTYVRIV